MDVNHEAVGRQLLNGEADVADGGEVIGGGDLHKVHFPVPQLDQVQGAVGLSGAIPELGKRETQKVADNHPDAGVVGNGAHRLALVLRADLFQEVEHSLLHLGDGFPAGHFVEMGIAPPVVKALGPSFADRLIAPAGPLTAVDFPKLGSRGHEDARPITDYPRRLHCPSLVGGVDGIDPLGGKPIRKLSCLMEPVRGEGRVEVPLENLRRIPFSLRVAHEEEPCGLDIQLQSPYAGSCLPQRPLESGTTRASSTALARRPRGGSPVSRPAAP